VETSTRGLVSGVVKVDDAPVPSSSPEAQVKEVYRARMILAAVELVREHGYRGLDVDAVVAGAKVSRRTFYELLGDREQCFAIVLEEIVSRVGVAVRSAFGAEEPTGRLMGARAALETLVFFLEDERGLGTALIVDSLAAGPVALSYRARVLQDAIAFLDERLAAGAMSEVSGEALPLSTEWVVTAAVGMIHSRLVARAERGALVELVNPLMAMTVLPFVGRQVAEEERTRSLRAGQRLWEEPTTDLLKGLEIRITYRRLRVLRTIAVRNVGESDPSSQEIAEQAGINSPGQASRLLARLAELGLIENAAHGRGSGRPKAWRLTQLGQDVERSMRGRAIGGDELGD
jgi:AcrR family transcriptional regulator